MNKKILGFIVGAVILISAFVYFTKPAEEATSAVSNHTLGSDSTGVVLIEYGDFQCPACGQFHPILQQLKEQYKDRITFQFRHFPLEAIHINARAASRAAEAAGLQGKFWEMHDVLFENQNAWSEDNDPLTTFKNYAGELGLDVSKFEADYRSSVVNGTINADLAAGKALGATSTPTFVLNGERLQENPPNILAFAELLDQAIADKTGTQVPADQSTEPATAPEETTPTQ